MATKIVTKNSSTASAVPTASDLVQGELAVNVADKRLFTEDNGGSIVELGTNPSTIDINAGTIDGTAIGASSASTGAFTTLTATGIDVTGTATMDGLVVANAAVVAGDFDGGTAATYIRLQDDTDNFLFGSNNSLGNFLIKNETADAFRLSVANTGDISFYEDTGTTPKLFWDASAESLGIGTSSPAQKLSLYAGVGYNADSALFSDFAINDGAVNNNAVHAWRTGITGNAAGHSLTFSTLARTQSAYQERMRIDSSGRLLMGKTSATATGFGTELRGSQIIIGKTSSGTVNGIYFNHNSSYVGGLNYTNTATALATSSDQRLKENIADADDAGSKIDAIQVRKFDWKEDNSHQEYGFIAQELEQVFPYAVHTAQNEMQTKGVDYASLVPMMLKEIQSLRNRVAQLEE